MSAPIQANGEGGVRCCALVGDTDKSRASDADSAGSGRGGRSLDTVEVAECIEYMKALPDACVDAVISDLPYGTTACKWDAVIPFAGLWAAWKRLLKPNGAIVLTASQPFTSALVMSNVKAFRHEWIWKKDKGGNIAVLKYQPAKVHESVLVFGFESPRYNPQMEVRPEANRRNNAPRTNRCGVQGDKPFRVERSRGADAVKYPTSVKEYNCVRGGVHPTQKPLELMRYLVRTYTNPGDVVLDMCCGSGTTLVAAKLERRQFIGCDSEEKYVAMARKRLELELPWAAGVRSGDANGESKGGACSPTQ